MSSALWGFIYDDITWSSRCDIYTHRPALHRLVTKLSRRTNNAPSKKVTPYYRLWPQCGTDQPTEVTMTSLLKTFYAKPVEGCEECELLVDLFGNEATACNECVEYGEAELVETNPSN